jgi:threonine dehydratase
VLGVVVGGAAVAALQGSPAEIVVAALGSGGLAGGFRGLADSLQSRPHIAGLSAVGVPLALAVSATVFRLAS